MFLLNLHLQGIFRLAMFDYQRVTIVTHDYTLLVLIHHIISHY